MEHIKSYSQFVKENINSLEEEHVDEGIKTWVATALAALSLATSTPTFAANKTVDDPNKTEVTTNKSNVYTGKATGMGENIDVAIRNAKRDAQEQVIKQLGGGGENTRTSTQMSISYNNLETIKGGVTIDYTITVHKSNVKPIEQEQQKQTKSHIKTAQDAKTFVNRLTQKFGDDGFQLMGGQGNINGAALENIVGRFIDNHTSKGVNNFNIVLTTTDEASKAGSDSVKWSLSSDGQNWAVITPAP